MLARMIFIRKRKKCQMVMKMCKIQLFLYAVEKNANKTIIKKNSVDI